MNNAEKKKKITVSELAKETNVSPATISRVLNNRTDLVNPETFERIREAITKSGYNLPKQAITPYSKKKVIVLNIPNTSNLFYNEIMQGALSSASAHNCHLIFHQAPLDSDSIDNFLCMLKTINASGVILMNLVSTAILERIENVAPVIQCNEYNKNSITPYVSIDDVKSAKMATEFLISKGCTKIAFLNGPHTSKYARQRQEGFLEAMNEAQLTVPENWLIQLPEINYDMACSTLNQILTSEIKPNAIFAVSDTLAAAAIRMIQKYGYRVPKDIKVIGFDDTIIASVCIPTLTTVRQPMQQLGYSACEMLLDIINYPERKPNYLIFDTEIIIREST